MKRILIVIMLLFLFGCEPTEEEEVIQVSDTPYLKLVSVDNENGKYVLVPIGKVMFVDEVEFVVFQYLVEPFYSY